MNKEHVTFDESPLWVEVKDILNSPDNTLFDYKGVIHTPKENIQIWDLNQIELTRDYLNRVGETVTIFFKMGLGDYINRLYPYRQNLEFTLTKKPHKENGSGRDTNKVSVVTRYKVIFNAQMNPPVGGSELETYDSEQLNISDMAEITLELTPRTFEVLRVKTTGGAFRNVAVADIIKTMLCDESNKMLVDGKPAIDGVDLVQPDNSATIPNLVVPHGVHITALPTYLQQKNCGVYNRGIGTFLQQFEGKKLWFVYPTYDTLRFDQPGRKALFYAVPQEKLPQLDRSYRLEGNSLRIAVTAQRRYSDSAEVALMNDGSGYRLPDANAFMKKPVVMTEAGPKGSRAQLNHEVVLKDREDGLNYAPMSRRGPSANSYAVRSEVLMRHLGQLDVVWENADPDQLFPGMPCCYYYLSRGKVVSLKGTVLFVHAFTARVEKYNASVYRTTCRITIACEPQTKRPDLPAGGTVGD